MRCALCLEDKKLCRSHIVPAFLFRQLMGEEDAYFTYTSGKDRLEKRRYHLVEKLLCADCEQLLSKWEDYASRLFRDDVQLHGVPFGKHFKLSGLDYRSTKLFLMSVLWRMAITSNDALRGQGDLGVHKERLRKKLLASDPGESWRYGCSITAVMLDGKHLPDLIIPTTPFEMHGRKFYRMVIGGFAFSFYVASHPPAGTIRQTFFQENGDFILGRMELEDMPFLFDVVAEATAHDIDEKDTRV